MPIIVCMILEHCETVICNWDAGVCDLILQVSDYYFFWQSLIATYADKQHNHEPTATAAHMKSYHSIFFFVEQKF